MYILFLPQTTKPKTGNSQSNSKSPKSPAKEDNNNKSIQYKPPLINTSHNKSTESNHERSPRIREWSKDLTE
jgi:hypothetical protein